MDTNQKFSRQGAKALRETEAVVYQTSLEEIPCSDFSFSG
jgi:hypothetical protein